MKRCPVCGNQLEDSVRFCRECGASLDNVAAEPAQTEPAEELIAEEQIEEQQSVSEAAVDTGAAPEGYTPYSELPPEPVPPKEKKPNKHGFTFLNTGLGFIPMGALLLAVLAVGMFTPQFFSEMNMRNAIMQYALYAALSMCAVMSFRANGLDLSVGGVMALSGVIAAGIINANGSVALGVAAAVVVAVVIGGANGVLTTFFKIPATLLTLVTAAVTRGIAYAATGGMPIIVEVQGAEVMTVGLAATLVSAAFAVAFVLIAFTRIGKPMAGHDDKKGKVSRLFVYVASAGIACFAGVYMVLRLRSAQPTVGTNYEAFLIFAAAAVYASKALDNRFLPAVYALVPAFVWTYLQNVLTLGTADSFAQMIVTGLAALVMLVIAYICRYEKKKPEEEA